MEELTLPRPALALWRRTRDTLLAARSGLDDEADGWRLGGGTLLAARWEHRVSTDIDLTVAEASERDVLLARNGRWLHEELQKMGGKPVEVHDRVCKVQFAEGRLDLARMDPTPRRGHEAACVDGVELTVLSTCQVLTGKLRGRGTESPVRDLYDVVAAAKHDPLGLARAVNTLAPLEIESIVARWAIAERLYQMAAQDEIRPSNEGLLVEPENIVEASITSMRHSRYEHVAIRCEDDHARIETRTADRAKQDITATAGNLEHVFEASGIAAYLQGHGSSPDRVRERVAEAMRAGGPGRVIWNSDQQRRPPTIPPPRRFPGSDSR